MINTLTRVTNWRDETHWKHANSLPRAGGRSEGRTTHLASIPIESCDARDAAHGRRRTRKAKRVFCNTGYSAWHGPSRAPKQHNPTGHHQALHRSTIGARPPTSHSSRVVVVIGGGGDDADRCVWSLSSPVGHLSQQARAWLEQSKCWPRWLPNKPAPLTAARAANQ